MSSLDPIKFLSIAARTLEQQARETRIVYRFPRAMKIRDQWADSPKSQLPYRTTVLLDARSTAIDGEQGRRFHALVSLLVRGHCKVWMVPHLRFMQSASKVFKWQALQHVHVHGDNSPSEYDLCISDHKSLDSRAKRTIQLSSAMHRGLHDNELAMPYGMHPDVYNSGRDTEVSELRSVPRTWKLFFGGYRQKQAYKPKSYYPYLKTVNRFEIVEEALKIFAGEIQSPQSETEFEECLAARFDGFVFVDNERYRIPGGRWLETLSHSEFFLAAPGTTYPMSHNCVESLAVGTIPILEYPSVFRPALQDGIHCITYDGLSGFRKLRSRLRSIDPQQVAEMSANAAAYYDEHLSATALVDQLVHSASNRMHMFAHLARPAA